jgi:hypothetical protein
MVRLSDEQVQNFFFRPHSFSLIYFTGDAYDSIPTFLTNCGYAIIREASYHASFFEILDAIAGMEGPRNTIVRKAAYRVSGGTVLLDPEMTVGVSHQTTIVQFCRDHEVDALVAIWERVSEAVIATHLSSNGLRADVCLMRGIFQKPPINPPVGIMQQAGPVGLATFLATAGAPIDAVFGSVSARVFTLDESTMYPVRH